MFKKRLHTTKQHNSSTVTVTGFILHPHRAVWWAKRSNGNVFSSRRNQSVDRSSLSSVGSLLHARKAAAQRTLSAIRRRVRGTMRLPRREARKLAQQTSSHYISRPETYPGLCSYMSTILHGRIDSVKVLTRAPDMHSRKFESEIKRSHQGLKVCSAISTSLLSILQSLLHGVAPDQNVRPKCGSPASSQQDRHMDGQTVKRNRQTQNSKDS